MTKCHENCFHFTGKAKRWNTHFDCSCVELVSTQNSTNMSVESPKSSVNIRIFVGDVACGLLSTKSCAEFTGQLEGKVTKVC